MFKKWIKRKGDSVRNPQVNGIIERQHDLTFDTDDLEGTDCFKGILAATIFDIRATHHTTLQASPSQLVFGRDAILNIGLQANWKFIRDRN